MDKWEGLVAVVTGASSGIGKAIALKLAEQGMHVAALARRHDRLQEMSEKFKGKGCIKAYRCDVSKDSDIVDSFKRIEKEMGRVRVLVNNAGIATNTDLLDFEIEKWKQIFDVNVFGMFSCIKQVMNSATTDQDKKLVHIFNINSIVGHYTIDSSPSMAYTASKHAVTLLTRGFLKHLALSQLSNVKVTSLSPGVVDTEIFEASGFKMDLTKIANLSPENVANALISCLATPPGVVISELTIKPSGEMF